MKEVRYLKGNKLVARQTSSFYLTPLRYLSLSLTLDIIFHHEIHFYTLAAVTFEMVAIYTTLMQLL